MPDDAEAVGRLQKALDAVQRSTPGGAGAADAAAMQHLLDEYSGSIQRLREAVVAAETRLHGVAAAVKFGRGIVRRERARTEPSAPPGEI